MIILFLIGIHCVRFILAMQAVPGETLFINWLSTWEGSVLPNQESKSMLPRPHTVHVYLEPVHQLKFDVHSDYKVYEKVSEDIIEYDLPEYLSAGKYSMFLLFGYDGPRRENRRLVSKVQSCIQYAKAFEIKVSIFNITGEFESRAMFKDEELRFTITPNPRLNPKFYTKYRLGIYKMVNEVIDKAEIKNPIYKEDIDFKNLTQITRSVELKTRLNDSTGVLYHIVIFALVEDKCKSHDSRACECVPEYKRTIPFNKRALALGVSRASLDSTQFFTKSRYEYTSQSRVVSFPTKSDIDPFVYKIQFAARSRPIKILSHMTMQNPIFARLNLEIGIIPKCQSVRVNEEYTLVVILPAEVLEVADSLQLTRVSFRCPDLECSIAEQAVRFDRAGRKSLIPVKIPSIPPGNYDIFLEFFSRMKRYNIKSKLPITITYGNFNGDNIVASLEENSVIDISVQLRDAYTFSSLFLELWVENVIIDKKFKTLTDTVQYSPASENIRLSSLSLTRSQGDMLISGADQRYVHRGNFTVKKVSFQILMETVWKDAKAIGRQAYYFLLVGTTDSSEIRIIAESQRYVIDLESKELSNYQILAADPAIEVGNKKFEPLNLKESTEHLHKFCIQNILRYKMEISGPHSLVLE